jgi:DNA polymerase/3'-5' exonuclease PolX
MSNEEIAARLEEVADLLELDPQANRYRVAAYREAASTLRQLAAPVADLFRREGRKGLQQLQGIGEGLAGSIEELLETGRLGRLDRLREQADPEQAIATLPGIGPVLAERIHRDLDVETLPELDYACPGEPEEQVTVVTENQGRLKGRRVVRGREQECQRFYQEQESLGRAAPETLRAAQSTAEGARTITSRTQARAERFAR